MSIQSCPVCHSAYIFTYLHLTSNNLIVSKCKECGHVFVKNSPISSANISDYYTLNDFKGQRKLQNEEWYTNYYSDCFVNYEQRIDTSSVLKQFQEKANYFDLSFPNGGRLLDVGCATGVFLDMMKKRGWDVEGIEISNELASYTRENFSIKVHVIDLTQEKFSSEPFHVITMFDVIEHIPEPNLMLAACRALLYDNGLLLLRTTTEESLLRDIAKALYWITLKTKESPLLWFYSFEHLHSFSLNTLYTVLKKHSFSIVKVFREDESLDRIKIPNYVKTIINNINLLASLLNKSHKITIIARK